MAPSPTDITAALQTIPEKKECVRKVFEELEEQRITIGRCSKGWKDLDSHLTGISEALEKRYAEIVDKETKFEAKMAELQSALDKRESVIESREQASLARVQEQKDAAVAAIREHKRKWIEERQLLHSQSPAKPDPDSASAKAKQKVTKSAPKDEASAKKEKDTGAQDKDDGYAKNTFKEDDSFKKNSKEGSTLKAKKAQDKPSSTPQKEESSKPEEEKKTEAEPEVELDKKQEIQEREEDGGDKQDSDMENAEGSEDQQQATEVGDEDGIRSGDDTDDAKNEDNKEGSYKKEENSKPPVKARPQLNSLCENMDGPGLRVYITGQKKDLNSIRKELPSALKCSSDPSKLVLKAIDGYYSSGSGSEVAPGKKLSHRRSCITLLEALTFVLDENDVADSIKEEVRKIADLWKSKLNPKGTDQIALLDAQSFLQLIATFQIADEYDEDELCNLVVPICNRKHVPGLWRNLGLANKASDLVERLVQDGKQLDAVTFIQEYELAEKFPPVPLLKAYLKDIRNSHSSKGSIEDKDELHAKELSGAQAVLKCLEKFKLEAEYPTEGLRRRISQLERVIPEKKRSSDAAEGGFKKSRTNGPGGPSHSGPFRPSDRPFGGRGGMGGRGNYGSAYGQGRGGGGGYSFPAGGPGYGASSFSHGNYQYGGGTPYHGGPYLR